MSKYRIDLSYLQDISGGDEVVIAEMIELFLSETPKYLNNLELYYAAREWSKLSSEAHKLKPTLMYIGLTELHDLAIAIEDAAKDEEKNQEIEDWVAEIRHGFESISKDLQQILQDLDN